MAQTAGIAADRKVMRHLRTVALVTGVVYLGWRLAFTHDGAQPVMFLLLLAAEVFGFVRVFAETSLYGEVRPPTRAPELTPAPDGDVVVIVTDEPASEVRAAVLSARLVHGYRSLIVVDRDDRPDVVELCARLRLERVAGGPDADLGDLIDVALDRCPSLYTLLMPADLVVLPDVLEVTAGAFASSDVAVVRCRVETANAEKAIDHSGYGAHRRRDDLMLATLDDAGVLPWWPGMAVVRRSALREIGGMSRGHDGVTVATGVRLQAAGWRITDVAAVVGRRLAPWTDDRRLHEWARDLHERLAVLTAKDVALDHDHATRLSRRVYRTADLHLGRSVQRLVLIGLLFAVLFGSSLPLVADPRWLLATWVPWMASSLAYRWTKEAAVGFTPWIVDDLRLMATDIVVAFRALPGKPIGLELVDPPPGRLLRTVLLGGVQVGLVGALALFGLGVLRPSQPDAAILASLVASAWLLAMTIMARAGTRAGQQRQSFRAGERLPTLETDMRVVGVSPFGLDVVSRREIRPAQKFELAFALPQPDGSMLPVRVHVAARRVGSDGRHHHAYLRFALLPDGDVDRITEYCAVTSGLRALRGDPDGGGEDLPATLVGAE